MKTLTLILLMLSLQHALVAQTNRSHLGQIIDTSTLKLGDLTREITLNEKSSYAKAASVLHWLSNRLDWKATDYQTRTVNQILARGGGNCFELAKVYMAMIRSINLPYRAIAEINLHILSDQRQQTAESKVLQTGARMSVFGRQHNDHRWLEVLDEQTGKWEPVDPSMNVIGTEQWLKARAWFGQRITIDTSITNDMIVPFAIFVVGDNFQLTEDRTKYYVVDGLNQLYKGALSKLNNWQSWQEQIAVLAPLAKAAFEGKSNLHLQTDKIAKLATTYQTLKQEFGKQQ